MLYRGNNNNKAIVDSRFHPEPHSDKLVQILYVSDIQLLLPPGELLLF